MSEYLSRDILEASYVRSFAPFRVLQAVLGSCRVDVRHSFVTPPTVRQKIYSVFVSIVTLVSYIFLVDFYLVRIFEYRHLYNLCLFGMVLNYAVYCSGMFNARFCNNEANAKFYVKLQEIDRKLNIEKSSYFDDFVFKRNIAALGLSSSIDLILFLASVCRNYRATLMSFGNFVSQVTCLTEWMHYSNIIVFLYARIYFMNAIVMNHLKLDQNSYVKTFDVNTNKFWETVQNLAKETNDFRHSDIVDCFKEVFIALRMFTVLYRFQVQVEQELFIVPVKWLINVLIMAFICVRWHAFFCEVEDTKHLCTKVLATHEGALRKKAARIIKIIEETPPVFSVYDMWNMDASLLLKMFNIMTTIIITLFQSALL